MASPSTANRLMDQRRSGIILHPTSLPGPGRVGRIGSEAIRFLDWIDAAGFGLWQVLPLNPPQDDGSPYACISAFAGDIRLIDPELLVAEGWLAEGGARAPLGQALSDARHGLAASGGEAWEEFRAFCSAQASWLEDFALFVVIKRLQGNRPWWEWPAPLRMREPARLAQLRAEARDALEAVRFSQFVFFRQWHALRAEAKARDILMLGDMPIFVAHDSVDVWAHPEYFDLDPLGQPTAVAGVPPDYFSETGQRWGNPHYRWDRMAEDGFRWWLQRIGWALEGLDGLRVDHFRGFEAYWSIPASEPTAIAGSWQPGPGAALFEALLREFDELPLLAEDLGVITPAVTALRERFALPGMKILQFAYDGSPDNPYLPERHEERCVVYTGTHDNDTTLGWFESLPAASREFVLKSLGAQAQDMPWALIETALASPARIAVIPMQDAIGLGGNARMNTPGTVEGNWQWRFDWSELPAARAAELRRMNVACGRVVARGDLPEPPA